MSNIKLLSKSIIPILAGLSLAIVILLTIRPLEGEEQIKKNSKSSDKTLRNINKYWAALGPAGSQVHVSALADGSFRGDTAYILSRTSGLQYLFPDTTKQKETLTHKALHAQKQSIAMTDLLSGSYIRFMKTLEKEAGKSGFDTLILDLSQVKAGSLNETLKIANQLVFNKGKALATLKYYDGTSSTIKSTGDVFFPLKNIEIQLSAVSGNMALLLAQMLEKGAKGSVSGKATIADSTIHSIYPLGREHFVAIPTGVFR